MNLTKSQLHFWLLQFEHCLVYCRATHSLSCIFRFFAMVKISCGTSNRPQKSKKCTEILKWSYVLCDLTDSSIAKVGKKAYAQVETSYQKMNQSLQKMGYLHEEEKKKKNSHIDLALKPDKKMMLTIRCMFKNFMIYCVCVFNIYQCDSQFCIFF